MSRVNCSATRLRRFSICLCALSIAAAALEATPIRAASAPAKAVGETAAMVMRSDPRLWHVVAQGEALPAGILLVGMHGAALESADGAVRLTMVTDLDGRSPYPVVESAVVLHDSSKADLDFTLDRGRVDLVNRKEKGAAHVHLHVRKATWDLTLTEPGTRLALLLYGRWPRGATFKPDPGPTDVPTADLVFLVIDGRVNLEHAGREYEMKCPPGAALIEWDSVTGEDDSPAHLDKLPDWAHEENADSPTAQATKARQAKLRAMVREKGIQATLDTLIDSDNADYRRSAVNAMAALDDLKDLGAAMRDSKHPDVIEDGILAMRRWIGRAPGQDQILYKKLIEVRKLSPVHAATVLQLLHSFGDVDLAQPETYQTLIDYLDHRELPIRALAYWHLSRLVPAGKKFGYQPQASKEEREAAIRQWRALLPAGKLPPRPGQPEK